MQLFPKYKTNHGCSRKTKRSSADYHSVINLKPQIIGNSVNECKEIISPNSTICQGPLHCKFSVCVQLKWEISQAKKIIGTQELIMTLQ